MSDRGVHVLRSFKHALPLRDRVWAEALIAELENVPARARTRWMMGLVPLVATRAWRRLWIGDSGSLYRDPSARNGAWFGLAVGAVISAGLAYSNLGPSSRHPTSDPAWATLAAYAVLACLFVALGFFARGRGRGVADCARAALTCAGVLTVTTFLAAILIDNVWLSVVARQPDKIHGLEHSALFHNMRLYVNGMNLIGLIVATPLGAAVGAALGTLGALLRRRHQSPPRLDVGAAS